MSEDHGPVVLKSIGEMAEYMRNFIPAEIPEAFTDDATVTSGVAAFRGFLHRLCDRLVSDGERYFKLPSNPKNVTDYPYLYGISTFLMDVGCYGALNESRDALVLTNMSLLSVKRADVFRFLALCGFKFNGVDVNAKTLKFADVNFLEVSYPGNPVLVAGLKALAVSVDEWFPQRRASTDTDILKCDYRRLKADAPEVIDYLKEFLHPLPKAVQAFALELHERYTGLGMTCVINDTTQFEVRFSYAFVKNTKRVLSMRDIYYQRTWELALDLRSGFCLVVRAKNTSQYADVIETFAPWLRQKIAGGYGCDRKLRNERCQCGCQGFRIPLDASILDIRKDVETWLERETAR